MPESPAPPWTVPLDIAREAHRDVPSARFAQLATVRPDGRPACRTVVVRGRLGPDASVLITTDSRSAKFGELMASPWAELCWYFPETREQFRLLGRVTVVGPEGPDGLSEARLATWAGLPDDSKRSFAGPPPGTPMAAVASALDSGPPEGPPPPFAMLVLRPEAVDHLDLRPSPHRRTVYRRDGVAWSVDRVNP